MVQWLNLCWGCKLLVHSVHFVLLFTIAIQVATQRNLRSAARHQLTVPQHRLRTYGWHAFAAADDVQRSAG